MNLKNSKNLFLPVVGYQPKLKEYLDSLKNGSEIKIESLPTINKVIGGFERKKIIVIGARPSEGKSAFALQLAYEFSTKFKVLYLSLEMTIEEAMFRLLCHHKKIINTTLYDGIIDNPLVEEFYNELSQEKRELIVNEEIGANWEEINETMEKLKDNPPDIIFLDYIQCIKTNGKKLEVIEDYIKNFRKMAIEKNICVFILSQINRTNIAENKEPTMEGLKNTGFLEEHADKVILLYYPCKRSEKASINDFKIIIAKNKNGQTGYVKCCIRPENYYFYEEVKEKQEEVKDWVE